MIAAQHFTIFVGGAFSKKSTRLVFPRAFGASVFHLLRVLCRDRTCVFTCGARGGWICECAVRFGGLSSVGVVDLLRCLPGCDFSTLVLHHKTAVELFLPFSDNYRPIRRLELAPVFRFVRIFGSSKV